MNDDVAIRVEGLGKRYRLGATVDLSRDLRDTLVSFPGMVKRLLGGTTSPIEQDTDNPDDFWALRDISFDANRGEALGIIGRNGAGKSTLLKLLSRITSPTEGLAEINGRIGALLEVGTGFNPELSGRENIYLNGSILGMSRQEIDKKFDEIVDFAGTEKFLETPLKRYSSGMRVRLGFAVAAHLEPEILIVDEVLSVGDAEFRKKCLGKMQDVAGQGRTVLFVSHNLTAVQNLCEKAIWLDQGNIKSIGSSNDIISEYLNETVSEVSERSWASPEDAPGNELIRMKRVLIRESTDEQMIDMTSSFIVEFEYWLLKDDERITPGIQLFNQDNIVVFGNHPPADNKLLKSKNSAGCYRCTFEVPANLLNSGIYNFKIIISRENTKIIYYLSDAIVFQIHDTKEKRYGNIGKRGGVIRPKLEWRYEKVKDS